MWGQRLRRIGSLTVLVALLVASGWFGVRSWRDADEMNALAERVSQLYDQGKHAEALPLAKQYLDLARQRYGEEHEQVAVALLWMGAVYRALGSTVEAEPLLRRGLSVYDKMLDNPDDPRIAAALSNLAGLYSDKGLYAEAEPLYVRALRITEKAVGPDHPDVAKRLNGLAEIYRAQGRYMEAEPLYRRALTTAEKTLPPSHPSIGSAVNNLATLYGAQGRYTEAEPLYRRGLTIFEEALGTDHPLVATALNNLALLYNEVGRVEEAEQLYKRALEITERALGADHPDLALRLHNLGGHYRDQGRYAEAEPYLRRALAIREKALGADHPDVGTTLDGIAGLYHSLGRSTEAEALHRRSLAVLERALGPDHPRVANPLNNLASLYQLQGRHGEAEPLLKRSLANREKALGFDHPHVRVSLSNLAYSRYVHQDWAGVVSYLSRSAKLTMDRSYRVMSDVGQAKTDKSQSEAERLDYMILVKAMHRLIAESPDSTPERTADTFMIAQWAQTSGAAASLAQMAARSAKGSPQLAALVRERQDLVSEWQSKDKQLIAAKGAARARRLEAEKALADRLATMDRRIAEIDKTLAQDFPDYAALASPAPLSVTEVQAQLGADEALVLLLDTREMKPLPEETFIWVVTRSAARWVRSDLGTTALTREVTALRCALDATAWDGGAERCAAALGTSVDSAPRPNQPLPFDHARAHKLYAALFSQVQDFIKGKHLLIVPSGPLTQLPFQVLVTKAAADGVRPGGSDRSAPGAQPSAVGGNDGKDKGGAMGSDPQGLTPIDHRAVAWLAREHAITVLPAVSSLKALRRVARPSAAPRPMIGVGNPLLDGPDARSADRARLARARQRCPETLGQWRVTVAGPRGASVARVETRGGLADLAHLKAQVPLPETADELCDVAHDVKANLARDIRLGAGATEREVKRLSASGELAKYRMVHFATHGTLAGELKGTHEPGLILTPPETATGDDDGYLSASEIATLKLDADWVVLSACNTAAGGATSAEALSGLGRAFIYAGARSLLVSHWAVYSEATVKLVTGAVREMSRDANMGRAEALRRSMLALIDKGTPEQAHPAFWAPFVVVGEGAAGR